MSPAAILSMPSLASDHPFAPKQSLSHSDMPPYAGWEYVNFGDDYSESDEQSVFSFDSVASDLQPSVYFEGSSGHPSPAGCEITLQNPEGQFIPEPQLCSEPQYMPQPELMPTIDPATTILPSTSVAYPPTPSPLFERRRRAATISTLPSPLTVRGWRCPAPITREAYSSPASKSAYGAISTPVIAYSKPRLVCANLTSTALCLHPPTRRAPWALSLSRALTTSRHRCS
ncbi:hypothetical protein C8Q79DRAFT_1007324 [Trametes meyenii]|nr:hypothetical protein C8Q79DRAFT_1007324 [Trametes meyenii]